MIIEESVNSALDSIKTNLLRSLLTALAIIIGTAAVIAMVGIGTGAQQAIEDSISSLGAKTVSVFPGQKKKRGIRSSWVALWLNDAEVNKSYDILFRETLTYMLEDTKNIASCTQIISVAKNLERIGDHIQNIAEMIYYYVTGIHITQKISFKEMKTYKKEKKYKTDISNIFKKAKLIAKK